MYIGLGGEVCCCVEGVVVIEQFGAEIEEYFDATDATDKLAKISGFCIRNRELY